MGRPIAVLSRAVKRHQKFGAVILQSSIWEFDNVKLYWLTAVIKQVHRIVRKPQPLLLRTKVRALVGSVPCFTTSQLLTTAELSVLAWWPMRGSIATTPGPESAAAPWSRAVFQRWLGHLLPLHLGLKSVYGGSLVLWCSKPGHLLTNYKHSVCPFHFKPFMLDTTTDTQGPCRHLDQWA